MVDIGRFTRKLGRFGPQVNAVGFGTMGLSAYYSPPEADEERIALLDHVYKSGGYFWEWFKLNPGKREKIFLATKFGIHTDRKTSTREIRNEPEYIQQACERSLKRLGVEYIDLYYCHRIQSSQPIEITVAHIDAVQVEYSPFSMEIESPQIGLLAACRDLGVAVVAYSPLGRGFLTGSIKSVDDFEPGDSRLSLPRFSKENFGQNLRLVDQFKSLAAEKGCTPGQLVLAFLLAQGEDIILIPGTTKIRNFEENMASLKVNISAEENSRLRKAIEATEVRGSRYPEFLSQSLFADTVPLHQ
ncbi:hypothetical protein CNMCM6805_002873 [Aspergillus fumigatiaffinis]|uniref:NADP-dependent oxidoreductase domain-containing protein n=1 Tax=Aspergillus fumigatiaffinis TaxID=340414 RepID=A0A8H4GSQ0_9EURO|nr:hypothetical protein CNMCM5878_003931 [Aspergillus fumigatiaffinis]KAF4227493.1 hypothetical protein CNMCM6805_002873 [Aspergillus fumigatiaffinis]